MGIVIKGVDMPTIEQGVRTINIYADAVTAPLHGNVPVVRCGECENWQRDWKPSGAKDGTHFCAMVGLSTSADWFCADGERRGGDGE